MNKRPYTRPEITRIVIDNTISALMWSPPPPPTPDLRAGSLKSNSTPFQSPFGDKPFS